MLSVNQLQEQSEGSWAHVQSNASSEALGVGRSEVSGPKSQVSGTKPAPSKKRAAETEDDVMPHDSVSQVGGPTAAVPRGNPAGSAGIPEAPPRTAPSVAPSFVSAATSLPRGQLSKARQLRAHVVLCAFSLDRRILNWAPPAAIAEYLAQGYTPDGISLDGKVSIQLFALGFNEETGTYDPESQLYHKAAWSRCLIAH